LEEEEIWRLMIGRMKIRECEGGWKGNRGSSESSTREIGKQEPLFHIWSWYKVKGENGSTN
jgi:hypothetical protein